MLGGGYVTGVSIVQRCIEACQGGEPRHREPSSASASYSSFLPPLPTLARKHALACLRTLLARLGDETWRLAVSLTRPPEERSPWLDVELRDHGWEADAYQSRVQCCPQPFCHAHVGPNLYLTPPTAPHPCPP